MTDEHGWTPAQVDTCDPDFLDALVTYKRAKADHLEAERKKAERRRR